MTKPTSVTAQLQKLDQDRKALEERTKTLRKKAATALGQAVVDAGGLELDPKDLKSFLQAVLKTGGIDAAKQTLLRPGKDIPQQTSS